LQHLVPCSESPQDDHATAQQEEQEAWDVDDVELEFFDINCVTEQREEEEPKPEVLSTQASCSNCLPTNQSPLIDAEERALLNLLKFDNRGPRGSRWNAPGVSRRYVTLVEWPKRGDESDKHKDRMKKRARFEKTSSMLERLQSCLTRAEAHKAAAASLDSAKALEGDFIFCLVLNDCFCFETICFSPASACPPHIQALFRLALVRNFRNLLCHLQGLCCLVWSLFVGWRVI